MRVENDLLANVGSVAGELRLTLIKDNNLLDDSPFYIGWVAVFATQYSLSTDGYDT